ncbi:hypothetical protein [Cryobacterium lyxosi]|uniref:Uncharacterized protein n=1 Tax=Cryobacterium lyxosi TaxID=1259228 RepID=A0A4R8ZG99_9MICO|nr:hypothetical protein [Cryobacterium lyxosi]TFD26631.1 hypothetical protein E3T27_07620 [Cryobacterium lyxosi]
MNTAALTQFTLILAGPAQAAAAWAEANLDADTRWLLIENDTDAVGAAAATVRVFRLDDASVSA